MTEDEAKTKWCPMVRCASSYRDVSYNANHSMRMLETSLCIASDCMMWQWDRSPEDVAADLENIGSAYGPNHREQLSRPADGHCGLAK